MTSSSHRFLSLLCAFAGCAAIAKGSLTMSQADQALSQFDQDVGNYNLISFGNATFTNYGDTQGGLEVGGNLSLDAGTIAAQPNNFIVNANVPTLYVKGTLTDTGNSPIMLNSGYAALPGVPSTAAYTWNSTTDRLAHSGTTFLSEVNSTSTKADTDPRTFNPNVNFTNLKATFAGISTTLALGTTTGTIKVVGQTLEFLAPTNASGVVFFDLNASNIVGNKYNGVTFSNVRVDVGTNLDFVVNVENANNRTLFGVGNGINFNSGTNDSRLLWNFEGSGSVNLGNGGDFYGSVLAANYSVSNDAATTIDGQVVANSFYDSCAELHYLGFDPDLPPAPEPSTYGLAGAALLSGLVFLRRRRARS
jgi:choice-of-anchor A domain-containing protein